MPRTLGIDYGRKRMGFAVSDPDGIVATPLRVATVSGFKAALDTTVDCISDVEAEEVVVGLPLNMDGTESEISREVQDFVAQLSERISQPVYTWDERLSSMQSERVLIEANVSRAKRKKVKDKLAAQLILQSYLDSLGF